MATIGDLDEVTGKLTLEWKIKNFPPLSNEIERFYNSPKFYFSGTYWMVWIYLNQRAMDKIDDHIVMRITRESIDHPKKIKYTFHFIKNETLYESSQVHRYCEGTVSFDKNVRVSDFSKLIPKCNLKNCLFPSDTLRIQFSLEIYTLTAVAGSLSDRYDELSKYMKGIWKRREYTDVTLKVNGEDIPAHRMILKRSPVFAAMLRHDMKENQTGEICIEDIEKSTMDAILKYLYSGDIDNLTTDNVFSIYTAAAKYDIKKVKGVCSEFIIRNLSVDWICDVIKLGKLHEDENIILHSEDYVKNNAPKILKTEKWKKFSEENVDITLDVFSSILLSLHSK